MAGTVVVDAIKSSTTSAPTFQNTSGTEIGTLCRAWVNFNGTGTVAIRASFNVSSITDIGNGAYTVNFISAFADTNYSCLFSAGDDSGSTGSGLWAVRVGVTRSTTGVQVRCGRPDNGSLVDATDANIAIFR